MAELELRGIRKRYRRKTVLRDVTMSVSAGCCAGLLGCNGSGKSTLLRILAGVSAADGGSFLWKGKEMLFRPAARRGIVAYVPQGTPLMEELSALDNLRLWYDRGALEAGLERGALKTLGVGGFLHTRVSRLSGGMKKRLSIACALASGQELLLLDEPSTALDLACKAELLDLLRQLRAGGATLLLASHDLQELSMCDSLWLLRDGVVLPCEKTEDPAALAGLLR